MEFSEVVETLRPQLDQVETRLRQAADVDYPLVGDFLSSIVAAGGKRLRPALLLLSAKAFDVEDPALIPAAAGIEMLHTASLIHDDTIDHALFRRGQPTLNTAFNSETVILLGDYLFAQSAILATETMNPRVVRVFATTLGHICDGQLREIFTGHRVDQSRDEYEARIFGKTASLFAASAEMGAILANASEEGIVGLREFGRDVGMAFQIVDDVLDFQSTTTQTGKPVGADLRQGTVTLPTMLFMEEADGNQTATLVRKILDGESVAEEDLVSVTATISQSDAISQAIGTARHFQERAVARLDDLPNVEAAEHLRILARSAVERLA